MLADGGGVARPRSKRQRSDATAAAKGPEKEQVDKEDNDEEEAEAEEEADIPWLQRPRHGPLGQLVSQLEAFFARLERPTCDLSLMKKNLKPLLLDGTYITSSASIESFKARIKKIDHLEDLKRFVSQLIETFNLVTES